MSLFGDEDDLSTAPPPASKSRISLFDDESVSTPGSKSSLFADDDNGPAWGMPTPKKATRGELIKNLLPVSDVPDVYIDIFDHMLKEAEGSSGTISAAGVTRVLSAAKMPADHQSRIMSIVGLGDLSRGEFNVLLALVGLAQEGSEDTLSLDSVDERRKNLPEPQISGLFSKSTLPGGQESTVTKSQRVESPPPTTQSVITSPQRPRTMKRNSLDFPETDPWGSPALHKGHNHETLPQANGSSRPSNGSREPTRTTSNFTTASMEDSNGGSIRATEDRSVPVSGVWGSYEAASNMPFGNSGDEPVGNNNFDGSGDGGERPVPEPIRSFGGGRVTTGGIEETVVITLLPEKEGVFLFQHHNYQVSSVRRGSKVVRRYSDFVWLLDCLHKRFPFRVLPLLPPKRVGVNGNHLAADSTFIEKRRRGLARFANALVRHPILSQEQLVIMFLTVPTYQELAVWRKQATISVQEEFSGKILPPGLEDSLSPTLNDLFDRTRTGVRRSAEIYINLCNLLDRLTKRNEGLAADQLRVSLSLQSLAEVSEDTYATDTNDCPLLNEGLHATAKHLSNSQTLLEDEARAWDLGVLEDMKRQRDSLVGMRDMFDRRDRYDRDNIPYLERRIQSNENKLVSIRSKPEVKPGEIEKVTEAIIKDKESIVAQHARGVFIKECVRDELVYFQSSQYHVSRTHQDWAQERVKYSELQADNWKQLHDQVESMPVGE